MHSACKMFQWSHTMPALVRQGYSVSISKILLVLFDRIHFARYNAVSFINDWTWEKGSELFFSHSFCCSDLSFGVVDSIDKDRTGHRYVNFLFFNKRWECQKNARILKFVNYYVSVVSFPPFHLISCHITDLPFPRSTGYFECLHLKIKETLTIGGTVCRNNTCSASGSSWRGMVFTSCSDEVPGCWSGGGAFEAFRRKEWKEKYTLKLLKRIAFSFQTIEGKKKKSKRFYLQEHFASHWVMRYWSLCSNPLALWLNSLSLMYDSNYSKQFGWWVFA